MGVNKTWEELTDKSQKEILRDAIKEADLVGTPHEYYRGDHIVTVHYGNLCHCPDGTWFCARRQRRKKGWKWEQIFDFRFNRQM